ncbi:MAG TPA: adenylate/guanylate cyclase domain-containing protein, partial [Ilumatobacteraceae bacterium]|nr:adenylate/guanylate cyclase domain-containing protein [Ilumatobacteraceae bacterium]
MNEREQLERAIAAQEQLRGVVADEIVDLTVESLQRQLSALESTDQRRRHATVLFADVHGFTRMSSGLDAEVVTDVMNQLWDRLDGAITSFGGHIDKHLGDGVMALWGADAARENDPEQAVRAALAMQGALAAFNDASDHDLSMRVGITTGPVVLGEVASTREFTAMGDTVNVAARLESAAPLGGVLISHDTYRHVRGIFDVAPLAPITVKGKDEPLQTYSVLRSKPRAFRLPTRGVEGVETEMVGRRVELQALRDAFQAVSASAGSQVVTVVGDAGVGKSRLLYEMESWIELRPEPVYYLKARALATRQDVPYGVFRDLLASRFEILDSDTPSELAEKLRRGFAPHLTGDQAELVGHWMGFDIGATDAVSRVAGATTLTLACVAHLARFLRAVSAESCTLLVVEDLHWADPASVELLGRLIDGLRVSRVLVVGATRPVFIQEHPGWLATTPGSSRLVLERLDEHATRALAREILRKLDALPDSLVALVAERADGNPFFVEELIKMFIDDGVIDVSDDEAWHLDLAKLESAAVPTTLTG